MADAATGAPNAPAEQADQSGEGPVANAVDPRRSYPTPFRVLAAVLGVGFMLIIAYPIFKVISGLVWANGHFTLSAITQTVHLPGLPHILLDTAIVVTCSGACALVIGSWFAWLNERTNARIPGLTDILPIVPFLVPTIAGALGWLFLLSPSAGFANWVLREFLGFFGWHMSQGPLNISSWYGVIFVYTTVLVPFVFLVVSAGLRGMDTSLEEQSRVSGHGLTSTLFHVTLPSLRLSLIGATFLTAWFGLAVFSIPLTLAAPANIDVVAYEIVNLLVFTSPAQFGPVIGLGFMVMIVLGVIWYMQRRALRNQRFSSFGGKSQHGSRIELRMSARILARLIFIGYLIVTAVLPVIALLLVALNGFWTTDIGWGALGLHSFSKALDSAFAYPGTGEALYNSLILGALAATVGTAIACVISWWSSQSRRRLAAASSLAIKVPAAVSTIVIAVGFILSYAGTPLYLGGTVVILFVAYLAISMPEASVSSEAAIGQVGKDLVEASRVSGASDTRTFLRIYVPLMLPGLAAGWTLVFVRVIGDLEASAILAGTGNPVVGFQILGLIANADYAGLAALALLMTCISAVSVAVVLTLVRRRTVYMR